MREHYFDGRAHAAIKHFFLQHYLERLALKTLQVQRVDSPAFTYIDGFTGPWGSNDEENYSDTSFGIALEVLKRVKTLLKKDQPNIQIRCVFCETRRKAFKELEAHLHSKADDLEVRLINGKFEENIDSVEKFIGRKGFLFAFIDPKGWKVDTDALTPLLKGRWSEVLFNFMAQFAGRFPDIDQLRESYAALLANVDWRAEYDATPDHLSNDERLLILLRKVVKNQWGFRYVLELPIRKPNRDQVLYKLVYGTRSPHGVIVFRDAQAKAEKEGFAVADEALRGQQLSFISSDEHAEKIAAAVGVGSPDKIRQLEESISSYIRAVKSAELLNLTASVLEVTPARKADVDATIRKMTKTGELMVSNADGSVALKSKSIIALR